MSKFFVALSFAAAASYSGGLVTFTAGNPAKAEEVNRNFTYLDSAKASVSSVDVLTSAVSAKAEKSALAGKTDNSRTDSLAKALGGISTSSLHALADSGGTLSKNLVVNGNLTVGNGIASTSIVKTIGGTIGEPAFRVIRDNAPANAGIWDMTTDQAGGSLFLRTINDAQNSSAWAMKIDRSGTTPTAISLFAPTTINGGLTASSLQIGTPLSPNGSPATFRSSGGVWNEGPEILPSSQNGLGGIIFRSNTTDWHGSVGWFWKPHSRFYLAFAGMSGMVGTGDASAPMSIDTLGNAYFGSSVTIAGKAIATSAQITDLRVAGSLKTAPTEPWADYVFEPGYKPMALKEVEAFAKANGHLPEVPSAAEVQKDGVDLARMNAILLKKIEELTLHAVEQEKKMEAMQAEIREMKTGR